MKTNKRLEEIIKEKLNKHAPQDQVDAWERFQQYRQTKGVSTPAISNPAITLIAAAASVVAVLFGGILFYEQKNQNQLLSQEIKELRDVIDQQQSVLTVEDTKLLDSVFTSKVGDRLQARLQDEKFDKHSIERDFLTEKVKRDDTVVLLSVNQVKLEDDCSSPLFLRTNVPLAVLDRKLIKINQSSTIKIPTVEVMNSPMKSNIVNSPSLIVNEENDIKVKKWSRLRAGFEKKFAKEYTGNALEIEWQLSRRLAIGSGFSWNRFQKKGYRNENEFRKENKFSPRDIKGAPLPPSTLISTIITEGTEKHIPLYLTYRGSITPKVDYYIKAKAGINLEASQQVKFDFQDMNHVMSRKAQRKMDMELKTPLISNYSLSVGVEKNWSRLGAQIEAFYMKQNTEQALFVKESQYPGISAKLYYQLTQ